MKSDQEIPCHPISIIPVFGSLGSANIIIAIHALSMLSFKVEESLQANIQKKCESICIIAYRKSLSIKSEKSWIWGLESWMPREIANNHSLSCTNLEGQISCDFLLFKMRTEQLHIGPRKWFVIFIICNKVFIIDTLNTFSSAYTAHILYLGAFFLILFLLFTIYVLLGAFSVNMRPWLLDDLMLFLCVIFQTVILVFLFIALNSSFFIPQNNLTEIMPKKLTFYHFFRTIRLDH